MLLQVDIATVEARPEPIDEPIKLAVRFAVYPVTYDDINPRDIDLDRASFYAARASRAELIEAFGAI
jgi:hypothetical protein